MEQFSLFLIQVGRENYIDMFTNHLVLNCESRSEYLGLIQDLYTIMFET